MSRYAGEPYFEFRKLERRVKQSLLREKAVELGVNMGQLTLRTHVFKPVVYEGQARPRLLGADAVSASNLEGPKEIKDGLKVGRFTYDGKLVLPIEDGELDAITFFADLRRDGSPYMPDELVDEAKETAGLVVVMPRPLPKHANYWTDPFVMAEDTYVAADSLTPIKDYLANHGVTEGFSALDTGARFRIVRNFPGRLDQTDRSALMHLSGILRPDLQNSTFGVLD